MGAGKGEGPVSVAAHRLNEGIAHQNREVEIGQPACGLLGLDKGFDIGVVAGKGRHHRAAPGARRHDGGAHLVPHIHEAERPRRIGANPQDRRAPGPQGGEIKPHPAALLQGHGGLAQIFENSRKIIRDGAHDKTVKQGHFARGSGASQNAPRRQKAKIVQRFAEPGLPMFARCRLFRLGQGAGHPVPGVLDGVVQQRAVRRLVAVFHVPDAGGEIVHGTGCRLDLCKSSCYVPIQSHCSTGVESCFNWFSRGCGANLASFLNQPGGCRFNAGFQLFEENPAAQARCDRRQKFNDYSAGVAQPGTARPEHA